LIVNWSVLGDKHMEALEIMTSFLKKGMLSILAFIVFEIY